MTKRVYFGDFNLPVKASRIKRAKKYSDVTVTKFDNGEAVERHTVKPGRPMGHGSAWEPEETVKR